MSDSRKDSRTFSGYLSNFRRIGPLMGKGALVAPFVALIREAGPPWPPWPVILTLTEILQLLALKYVFHLWKTFSERKTKLRIRITVVATAVGFLVYFFLLASFVFNAPDAKHRDVKGFVYTEAASAVIGPNCTEDQALKNAGYEPTKIWKAWTVYSMRLCALVSWVFFFGSLSTCLACFELFERENKNRQLLFRSETKASGDEVADSSQANTNTQHGDDEQ